MSATSQIYDHGCIGVTLGNLTGNMDVNVHQVKKVYIDKPKTRKGGYSIRKIKVIYEDFAGENKTFTLELFTREEDPKTALKFHPVSDVLLKRD